MEIYNERVHDLLDLTPGKLQRKELYYRYFFASILNLLIICENCLEQRFSLFIFYPRGET
jgi:hypothetical protein